MIIEGVKVEEIIKAIKTESENREIINRYKQEMGMLENTPKKVWIGINEFMNLMGNLVRIKNNDGGKERTVDEWLEWLEKYAKK